jgi:uncharacterized membrane protein
VEVLLNAISLLFILAGIIFSAVRVSHYRKQFPGEHPLHTNFRMVFGGWLVVALEFQLAADIVATIVAPTTAHLAELGAIAFIRTFLNYFLNRELQEQRQMTKAGFKEEKPKIT